MQWNKQTTTKAQIEKGKKKRMENMENTGLKK